MKNLRQVWRWIKRELFFDLNRVYKNDFRRLPINRHERRKQAKEDRCWFSSFWRGVPGYKWREYQEALDALYKRKLEEWKRKNNIE